MLNRFKKEKDKEGIIAEAIINVRESRETVEALAPQFMEWSVEAAQMGDDAYSDELLNNMAELTDFVGDLKALEMNIRAEAVTAKALDNLSGLAKAIRGCAPLFKAGPRLASVGKDIQAFKKNMGEGIAALKGIRRTMVRGSSSVDDLFTGKKPVDSPKLTALKEERDRLLIKPATVAVPIDATGDIDLDAIIEDENSKK